MFKLNGVRATCSWYWLILSIRTKQFHSRFCLINWAWVKHAQIVSNVRLTWKTRPEMASVQCPRLGHIACRLLAEHTINSLFNDIQALIWALKPYLLICYLSKDNGRCCVCKTLHSKLCLTSHLPGKPDGSLSHGGMRISKLALKVDACQRVHSLLQINAEVQLPKLLDAGQHSMPHVYSSLSE